MNEDSYELTDLEGRWVIIPSSFLSKCQSIPKENMEQANTRYRRGDKRSVRISPGSVASHAANDTFEVLSLSDTTIDPPKVVYRNGDDPKEVALCLPFSLENGLHYI